MNIFSRLKLDTWCVVSYKLFLIPFYTRSLLLFVIEELCLKKIKRENAIFRGFFSAWVDVTETKTTAMPLEIR